MGKVKREYIFKSNNKTNRKTRKGRDKEIEDLQESVGDYPYLYIVGYLRAGHVKQLKLLVQDHSRVSLCKNTFCRVMMERMSSDFKGLDNLIPYLKDQVLLIFSQLNPEKMKEIIDKHYENDIPVTGSKSPSTLTLKEGPLPGFKWYDEEFFAVNSVPIVVRNRVVNLTRDYTVCKKGQILKDFQVKILNKLSNSTVSDDPTFPWVSFKFSIKACWSRAKGEVTEM